MSTKTRRFPPFREFALCKNQEIFLFPGLRPPFGNSRCERFPTGLLHPFFRRLCAAQGFCCIFLYRGRPMFSKNAPPYQGSNCRRPGLFHPSSIQAVLLSLFRIVHRKRTLIHQEKRNKEKLLFFFFAAVIIKFSPFRSYFLFLCCTTRIFSRGASLL